MIRASDWNNRYGRPRRRRRRHGCLTRLVTTVVVLAVLVGFFWWQQNGLSSETISVPSAPDGFAGYRIAVISDLHGKEFGEGNEKLLDYVRDLEPDCIAVVGDLLHEEEQLAIGPRRGPGPGGRRPHLLRHRQPRVGRRGGPGAGGAANVLRGPRPVQRVRDAGAGGRPHRPAGGGGRQRLRRPAHGGRPGPGGPGPGGGSVHHPPEPPEQPLRAVRRGGDRPHPGRPRPRGPHPPAGAPTGSSAPSGNCGRPTPPACTIWTTARWWSPGGWGTSSPVSGCSTGRMCPWWCWSKGPRGPGACRIGRWSGSGPSQVSTCEVVSRPVPGGDPGFL